MQVFIRLNVRLSSSLRAGLTEILGPYESVARVCG